MSRPFLLIGSVFFVSMCVFNYSDINAVAVVFAAAAILTLVAAVSRRLPYVRIALLALVCLTVSSGLYIAHYYAEYMPLYTLCDGSGHTVEGVIADTEYKYGACYVTLSGLVTDGTERSGKLTVCVDDFPDTQNREKLILSGAVISERGRTNGARLYYRSAGEAFTVSQYDTVRTTGEKRSSLTGFFMKLREGAGSVFREYLPERIAGLAQAMLTGDTSSLPDGPALDFRYVGLSHLFAVSGLHLTVWTGLIFFVLRRSKLRRLRPFVSTLFILFYIAFTGFSYSVIRSGVMLLIMNIAAVFNMRGRFTSVRRNAQNAALEMRTEYDSLSALFFAVTVILFVNPFAAVSTSLQMSFLTVLGILVFLPEVLKNAGGFLRRIRSAAVARLCEWLISAVAVSLAAAVAAMPVTIMTFGFYSPIGLIANPLALPAAEAFMVLSGIGAVLSRAGAVAKPVFAAAGYLGRYMLLVTERLSRLRYAAIPASPRVFAVLLCVCAGIGLVSAVVLTAVRRRGMIRRIFIFVISAVLVVSFVSVWYNNNIMRITAVNVGDGIAVKLQVNGECALLGCGGDKSHRYDLHSELDGNNRRDIAFLLLPGTDKSLSSYFDELIWDYDIGTLMLPEGYEGSALAGNILRSGSGAAVLDNRTTLSFICDGVSDAVYIQRENFSCLVMFEPTLGSVPDEWLSADLLITRSHLPEGDLKGFGTIFVSDSAYKPETRAGDNIYATSKEGNLEVTVN